MIREREVVATAVTNFDIHDIARCARTYRDGRFLCDHPAGEPGSAGGENHSPLGRGAGSVYNPTRKESLSLVRISRTIDEADREISELWQKKVRRIATGASHHPRNVGFESLRK